MPAYFQVTQLKIFRKVYMIFHKEAQHLFLYCFQYLAIVTVLPLLGVLDY